MKFQAALFLSALPLFSSAFLVIPSSESQESSPYLTSAAGIIEPSHVQVNFSVACEACVVDPNDGIKITLDLLAVDKECSADGLFINGVPLRWTATTSYDNPENVELFAGTLSFQTTPSNGPGEPDYYAVWNVACLDNEASLLQVQLHQETGDGSRPIVGAFSTSFRQTLHPEILKLDPTTLAFDQGIFDHSDWIAPSPEHRIHIVPEPHLPPPSIVPPGLREQLDKLSKLNLEEQFEEAIEDVKTDVQNSWQADFAHCSSLKCYVQTAIEDVPAFAKLVAQHFKHHTHGDADSKHQDPMSSVFQLADDDTVGAEDTLLANQPEAVPLSTPENSGELVEILDSSKAVDTSDPDESHPPFHHGFGGPPPWMKNGDLPPWGSGPPPWVKSGGRPPWGDGPPPWIKDGVPPPWAHPSFHAAQETSDGDQDFSFSHDAPAHVMESGMIPTRQQLKYHLIATMISFVIVSLVATLLFVCVRHRNKIFRNPRLRADCAFRREEWKRKKAYRKAAYKHRLFTFIQRFRPAVVAAELSEKTCVVYSKGQNEGSSFGQEIGNLRLTHETVEELMSAEEGRCRAVAVVETEGNGSITESLPAYSAPPDYAVDIDGDISVIDGFTGYTPSGTDRTPESSVIDCSPRMSFETQRTTITGE